MSPSIIILLFAILGIMTFLFLYLLIRNSKKKTSKVMSEDLVDQFVAILGGKDNLVRAFQEGGRTKITVSDPLLCNFTKLKELGATNIFISGNTVKMMCPFDTSSLIGFINQM